MILLTFSLDLLIYYPLLKEQKLHLVLNQPDVYVSIIIPFFLTYCLQLLWHDKKYPNLFSRCLEYNKTCLFW